MRRRFTRWVIQTVALWAAQRLARAIIEKLSEPSGKNGRKIAVDYERTGEQRLGTGATGSPTGTAADPPSGPATDAPPPSTSSG